MEIIIECIKMFLEIIQIVIYLIKAFWHILGWKYGLLAMFGVILIFIIAQEEEAVSFGLLVFAVFLLISGIIYSWPIITSIAAGIKYVVTGIINWFQKYWKTIAFTILLAKVITITYFLTRTSNRANYPAWNVPPPPAQQAAAPTAQPSILYKGCKLENAIEIFNTKLWLVGDHGGNMMGVWMTTDIQIAKQYAANGGAILKIRVSPNVTLANVSSKVYVYQIPNPKPKKEYYSIPKLQILTLLNEHGNKIR